MKNTLLLAFILLIAVFSCNPKGPNSNNAKELDTMAFYNAQLPIETRVNDLISRLTIDEKISQLLFNAPAIERLGVAEYNWWNEACHGVARNGNATVFPQPIGLAATFDSLLIFNVANAISDEARAKFNEAQKIGNRGQYAGLTFWAPNINIFRDPRWGRGMETYGEDPYLSSILGVAFVKGMQGNNPQYLKTAACAKHYVVHSGPESLRHEFNALPSKKDFYETYTPAFKSLVQQANVEAVMCAYNRTYNEPCCGSKYLMQDVLRNEFGFKGHIVSDCWAVQDFFQTHKTDSNVVTSAARALKSGVNLNCGNEFPHLKEAFNQGLVTEAQIDSALRFLLPTRFKLGLFDNKSNNPYNNISEKVIDSPKHRKLALESAQKSIVMLKNSNNTLPLNKEIKKLFVIGPYAASAEVMLGNYFGVNSSIVTVLEGIAGKVSVGTSLAYRPGTLTDHESINPMDWAAGEAMESDAVVAVFGISNMFEGEEGETLSSPYKGDRIDLGLPQHQIKYLKNLRAMRKTPIILVLTGGSPICSPEIYDLADAVLFAWYPGEEGGNAVADVIFGNVNPSGRLPITFPKNAEQLPNYSDYSMIGRTYRYMTQEPLFPFGYGLSYTKFEYSDLKLSKTTINSNESITATITVKNVGKVNGDEIVQLYISDLEASITLPQASLKGFKRVSLHAGQQTKVTFTINPNMLQIINTDGMAIIEPGKFKVTIAGASPMPISKKLGMPWVDGVFEVN